jgi:hypothetical protein
MHPLWNTSNLIYVLFGREKFCLVYNLCLEYDHSVNNPRYDSLWIFTWFCVFSRKFFVNSLIMSSKKVNEKSQATKKMIRITMEVKKRDCWKVWRWHGMRIQNLVAAYRMPRTTVSRIVKNKDIIKSANIAKGVKSITKQRSGKLEHVEKGGAQD